MNSKPHPRSAHPPKQRARATRVQANIPLTIDQQTCQTRDISATGIYFEAPEEKTVGATIVFSIDLNTPGGPLQIQCSGKVVRVQQDSGKFGIAVQITDSILNPR